MLLSHRFLEPCLAPTKPPGVVVARLDQMEAVFFVETLGALPLTTASRKGSTPSKERSSRAPRSPACSPAGIAISMDGRGVWRDNVLVEGLWRSVEYQQTHLRAYNSVSDPRASIGRYLDLYMARVPTRA
ncbi:hypothetical protein ACVWY3_004870 [Bradyrhizobium sp. USDA 4486]